MRLLVALILVLSLAPLPTASAASWSLDARVTVTSATTTDYTWTIGGLTNTNLTLPLPDNATFVEARDRDGKKLDAGKAGDDIYVISGSKTFTVHFTLAGERDGPFSIFPAQVAADRLSPVTVALALPSGYTLSGYRDSDEDAPDASGVFHKTGPAYVQFLVLPPGIADPGPDLTIAGETVKRHGEATIGADGIAWTLTTTYDTDVFSRAWEVHLPEGAAVLGASTPFGPLDVAVVGGEAQVRTPYPVGYGLGARSFTLEMSLPAPDPYGGAFRQANLSVRAADGDIVTLDASLADGLRAAGARVAGGSEIGPLSYAASGPLSVTVAFLPPAAPGHMQFEEGLFVVDVPTTHEAAARATARSATAELARVADFAASTAQERPFFAAYTDAPIFGWEEGFYSNGLDTMSIRLSTLDDAADGQSHLTPVGVLVHEATHGLVDRLLPDAPHELSFLHEGLSRLAETRLEASFEDEVVRCRTVVVRQECTLHSARPGLEEVRAFHADATTFDTAWTAGDVASDEGRGFLYDYSGLVLHAYDTRAPEGALTNALAHIAATEFPEDKGAQSRLLTDILLANAPGTTERALLYPGRELVALTDTQFRACMGDLLAPPYPWEDEPRAPPGGCPATGYGGQDATLPPPPEEEPEPEPASPTPVVSTRPTFEVPTSFPTTPTSTDPGEVPGGVVEPIARPGSSPTPGAGAFAALVALAIVALARRR